MAYDALTMRAVVQELNQTLSGGRINRIFQTSRFDIILQIHSQKINYRLRVSAHPQQGGVYLTDESAENPTAPPMFCMLLRKHLEGIRIERIFQKDLERVMIIACRGIDETGLPAERWLVAEIMGKHSNIVLTQGENKPIIDSIRRVSHQISRVREILPGTIYTWPPPQERFDPFGIDRNTFQDIIVQKSNDERLWKILLASFEGLGPLSSKEIVGRAGLETDAKKNRLDDHHLLRLYESFRLFWDDMGNHQYVPTMVIHPDENRVVAYAPYTLAQYPGSWHRTYPTMNSLLAEYFAHWAGYDRLEEIRNSLVRSIHTHAERTRNKIAAIQESLLEADRADELRTFGEIITANMHRIQKGDDSVQGPDYRSHPEKMVTVPLDPQKKPAENAQMYFRRYAKAKKSQSILAQQLISAQQELAYLESTDTSIVNADTPALLRDIRKELQDEGYLKEHRRNTKSKPSAEKPSQPMEISDDSGFRILIGRNNRQNDLVSMRIARNEDIWLHVKDMPGSHVIIQKTQNADFNDDILQKAAEFAAYFSQARQARKVPVDYTYRKHVRKPRGAKPGMVIYDHQKTILVTPRKPDSGR